MKTTKTTKKEDENENDEEEEIVSRISFEFFLMNTGRTLRRIEEIAYLSATQKASVNVNSKLK